MRCMPVLDLVQFIFSQRRIHFSVDTGKVYNETKSFKMYEYFFFELNIRRIYLKDISQHFTLFQILLVVIIL
jgi:hypothetical protein